MTEEQTTRQCCAYRDKKLMAAEVAVLVGVVWGLRWNHLSFFIVLVAAILLIVAVFRTVREWVFITAAALCGLEGIVYILTMIRINKVLDENCEEDDGTVDTDGTCSKRFYLGMTAIGLVLSIIQVALLLAFVNNGYVGEEQVGIGQEQVEEAVEVVQEKANAE